MPKIKEQEFQKFFLFYLPYFYEFEYIYNSLRYYIYIQFFQIQRLYTSGKTGSTANSLLTSPYFKEVVENNIDLEKSFGDPKENIRKVLKEPETAMFYHKSTINNLKEFECKVIYITLLPHFKKMIVITILDIFTSISIEIILAHISMD